jgi:hypothetical protein
LELDMVNFREELGRSESGGRYGAVNREGYTGKYQFGPARLADYMNATGQKFSMAEFKNNPALQERVQSWHEGDILNYVADNELDQYIGQVVGGVKITPQSMLGMAHLGGKSGMRRFLETGGEYNPEDSNGTSLRDYGQKFSGQNRSAAATGTRPSDTSKGIIPQAEDKQGLNALARMAEEMYPEKKLSVGSPPSLKRTGRSGRMSPLSGVGIPGLGNIKRYSTPGGIESLYRKS